MRPGRLGLELLICGIRRGEVIMGNFIFGVMFMLCGISVLLYSTSKKIYQRVVAISGEKHAARSAKQLRFCGIVVLICGAILLLPMWWR